MTTGDQWQAPSQTGGGREARQQPRKDRRAADHLAAAGAALGGVADFLGLAVYNTQSVYFSRWSGSR
jgi:hypothetical protein